MNEKTLMLSALSNLSDRDLQIRSWTGIGPEVSSPFDAIDDFLATGFEEFIVKNMKNLTSPDLKILNGFMKRIKEYDEDESDIDHINRLIDSDNWIKIRDLAQQVEAVVRIM